MDIKDIKDIEKINVEELNNLINFILENKDKKLTIVEGVLLEQHDKQYSSLVKEHKDLIEDYNHLVEDYNHLVEISYETILAYKKLCEIFKERNKELKDKNDDLFIENFILKEELEERNNRDYSVYIHILPNNSIYIGQTKQKLNERWHGGEGYSNNSLFYTNIKKFGWENIYHLLVKDGLNKKEADELETTLIRFYSRNEIVTGRVVLNIRENENK